MRSSTFWPIMVLVAILTPTSHSAATTQYQRPPQAAPPAPCATRTPLQAVRCLWPAASRQRALRVAQCESTADAPASIARRRGLGRWAVNGDHVGVFQLGARERHTYGAYRVGASAATQVRAAIALHAARGWQPWTSSNACSTR